MKIKGFTPISVRYRRGILWVSCSMLLLYLLATFLYSSRAQEAQFLNREYANLEHTMKSLQVLISSVEDSSKAIISDDIVQQILTQPSGDQYADSQQIRKQIGRYMNNTRYLDAVVLYGKDDRIYDSGSIVLSVDALKVHKAPDELMWLPVHTAPYYHTAGATYPYVISMTRPIYNYKNYQKMGSIEIMVNESTFTEAFLSNRDQRSFYFVDADNVIVAHSDKSLLMTTDTVPLLNDGVPHRTQDAYVIGISDPHTTWQLKGITPFSIVFDPIYKILWTLFAIGVGIIGISIAFSRKTAAIVTQGISQLITSVRKIQGLQERIPPIAAHDETSLLCEEFNHLLDKLETASTQLVQEQISKRRFQTELLQQQIAPHFLYNTLENICCLAELGHSDELIDIVNNMARFYRGVLSKGNVRIPLKSEIEIAHSYLNILQIRSRYQFEYIFNIKEELLSNCCIKLILQPVLENSVFHGLASVTTGGYIRIDAETQDNILLLKVSDNGKGMTGEQIKNILNSPDDNTAAQKSYGLKNVHKRLQLYYGESCGIEVLSTLGKGTTVILRLPLEEWRKNQHDQSSTG